MAAALANIRSGISYLKAHKKKLFWYWIGYQCIKGTITTSLIWVPLLLVYFHLS